MSAAQLVFFQPRPGKLPVLFGEVAQYDECEEDIDPETQVPVRCRGRVMAAPVAALRAVG